MDTKNSTAPAPHPAKLTEEEPLQLRLLEERYRHELMDDEERLELRERILRRRRQDAVVDGNV